MDANLFDRVYSRISGLRDHAKVQREIRETIVAELTTQHDLMAECIQKYPSMFDRNLYCVVPTYKHMLSRIDDAVDAKLEASPHITDEAKENIMMLVSESNYGHRYKDRRISAPMVNHLHSRACKIPE